jgi:hypothetical protein
MPVHIDEMTSDVSVVEGDFPLTDAQVEKLMKLLMKRLAEKQQDTHRFREATKLRRQSSAPFEPGS